MDGWQRLSCRQLREGLLKEMLKQKWEMIMKEMRVKIGLAVN